MKINMDWPSVKQDSQGSWPPANPNWFKQQDLMASLGPFAMGGGGGGGGGGGQVQQAAAVEEVKEEVKVEKTHFDVELSSSQRRRAIANAPPLPPHRHSRLAVIRSNTSRASSNAFG